jgi:hypothetical protein
MFDRYIRYGKVHFLYAWPRAVGGGVRAEALYRPAVEVLKGNGRADRVLFILRPGEEKVLDGVEDLGPPIHQVARPDGQTVLVLREKTL